MFHLTELSLFQIINYSQTIINISFGHSGFLRWLGSSDNVVQSITGRCYSFHYWREYALLNSTTKTWVTRELNERDDVGYKLVNNVMAYKWDIGDDDDDDKKKAFPPPKLSNQYHNEISVPILSQKLDINDSFICSSGRGHNSAICRVS